MMDEGLLIYIDSLEQGKPKSREEWLFIIKAEERDLAKQDERIKPLSPDELRMIIDTLDKDGYIKH